MVRKKSTATAEQSPNGFKVRAFPVRNRTTHLTFEGTAWEGVEAIVKASISIASYLELERLVNDNVSIEVTRLFGDNMLVSWNLVDETGKPIPATGDGMASLPDMPLALHMVHLWLEAVAGVPGPLGVPSGDGSMLVAASTALAEN